MSEFADTLCDLGHAVRMLYPVRWRNIDSFNDNRWFGAKKMIRDLKSIMELSGHSQKIDWMPRKAELRAVPSLSQRFIPNSDVIFATAVDTAEWVSSYSPSKGDKWYLIQAYEKWHNEDRIHASWKLPLKHIVTSNVLKDLVKEKVGIDAYEPVVNGVNFEKFFPDYRFIERGMNRDTRVGMIYHPYWGKGVTDGLVAFRMAKKRYPELKLVLLGKDYPRPGEIPDEHKFHYNPPQSDVRKIYSSCAIWLMPSWHEGCACVPAEAMACKCAVVSTDVGGVRDYSVPGETCLISPPQDPEALADNIISLLNDDQKRTDMSEKGYEHIQRFTWQKATKKLLHIIKESKSNG
ncbi:MAG: glycosyltransferase family 4 protein [Candidatus Cloacimonetes bacterium]|nr:glycosyltransferase family 4 protein [Candidatus Cloacimonadota bacterium]